MHARDIASDSFPPAMMNTPITDMSRSSQSPVNVVDGYTRSRLRPQLESLGLTKRQRGIIAADVTMRLRSLLFHWHALPFRKTILLLGTEEASFWAPQDASLDIRSLVAVGIRNSLIEDLHASRAYTKALRFERRLLPDEGVPWITGVAIEYFAAANFHGEDVPPENDIFGSLPKRFPSAWHVLSILGNSSETATTCELPVTAVEPGHLPAPWRPFQEHSVILSGIDPRLDDRLAETLRAIELRQCDVFFASSFKGITRNPEKLLSVVDHVLGHGGTILTPNYLLSPTYRTSQAAPSSRARELRSQGKGQESHGTQQAAQECPGVDCWPMR